MLVAQVLSVYNFIELFSRLTEKAFEKLNVFVPGIIAALRTCVVS
jgi:hypothetical protein